MSSTDDKLEENFFKVANPEAFQSTINVPADDYNAKKLVIATEGFSVSIDEIRELRALKVEVDGLLAKYHHPLLVADSSITKLVERLHTFKDAYDTVSFKLGGTRLKIAQVIRNFQSLLDDYNA